LALDDVIVGVEQLTTLHEPLSQLLAYLDLCVE